MASTSDTTPLNPFDTDATKHAAGTRQQILIDKLHGLRGVNYEKGSEISAELAALYAPSTEEDGDVSAQIAAAEDLSSKLDALLDFLGSGLVVTTAAPAEVLTDEEQMLLRDFRSGLIRKETAEQVEEGKPTVVRYAFADSRVGRVRRINNPPAPKTSAAPAAPAPASDDPADPGTSRKGQKGSRKSGPKAPAPTAPAVPPVPTPPPAAGTSTDPAPAAPDDGTTVDPVPAPVQTPQQVAEEARQIAAAREQDGDTPNPTPHSSGLLETVMGLGRGLGIGRPATPPPPAHK